MARPIRSRPKKKPGPKMPVVEDRRPIDKILPRSADRGNPNIPIRTVLYVEVQDMPAGDVHLVASKMLASLPNEHPHYVIPLRWGKLLTDFEFEGEVLQTIRRLCEVNEDGVIVLKGGARKVDVIRKRVQ